MLTVCCLLDNFTLSILPLLSDDVDNTLMVVTGAVACGDGAEGQWAWESIGFLYGGGHFRKKKYY